MSITASQERTIAEVRRSWDVVIGLEVHVELHTQSKLFCGCANRFGSAPNTNVCPICLGLPGVLPQLNQRAIELHHLAAKALGCTVHQVHRFDRKNYFYPDLPKNFQTSQLAVPLAHHGKIRLSDGKVIAIERIHLEEDAGKLIHMACDEGGNWSESSMGKAQRTWIDYNRTGVPLLEIVSEPDLTSSKEVVEYVDYLRQTLRWLEISDCKMEEGSLRCDANVSLKPSGSSQLGVKTEIKNMNSLSALEQAVDYEILRQAELLEKGESIQSATMGWDEARQQTFVMRLKEESQDYRYHPEPDIAVLDLAKIEGLAEKIELDDLPLVRHQRYQTQLGLDEKLATYLTEDRFRSNFFEECLAQGLEASVAGKWLANQVARWEKDGKGELKESFLTPSDLVLLEELIQKGEVGAKASQKVLEKFYFEGGSLEEWLDKLNLRQISDPKVLIEGILEVMKEQPQAVEQYREGKGKAMNVIVGMMMKKTQGRANPQLLGTLIKEQLDGH